ncbi:unnamed protein product, partial [Rotaria magnacalcarata]
MSYFGPIAISQGRAFRSPYTDKYGPYTITNERIRPYCRAPHYDYDSSCRDTDNQNAHGLSVRELADNYKISKSSAANILRRSEELLADYSSNCNK